MAKNEEINFSDNNTNSQSPFLESIPSPDEIDDIRMKQLSGIKNQIVDNFNADNSATSSSEQDLELKYDHEPDDHEPDDSKTSSSEQDLEPNDNQESQKKIKNLEYSEMTAKSVIGVVGLEPCIAFTLIDQVDKGEKHKVVGVIGFYDPKHKEFYHLDGSPTQIKNFNAAISEYADKIINQ